MIHCSLHGTFVTLVTPLYRGSFDALSMRRLIESLEPNVDGFIPCASTGEGDALSDVEWEEVIRAVTMMTSKPVIAGIKSRDVDQIKKRAAIAKDCGCCALLLPIPASCTEEILRYFQKVCECASLPIVLYNTETDSVDVQTVVTLQQLPHIIGLKDSSMDLNFFKALIQLKQKGEMRFLLFQGMEQFLTTSSGCDGSMTALANIHPALCKQAIENPDHDTTKRVREAFWTCNLGGRWYASIKAILFSQGILRSAEELHPDITPE